MTLPTLRTLPQLSVGNTIANPFVEPADPSTGPITTGGDTSGDGGSSGGVSPMSNSGGGTSTTTTSSSGACTGIFSFINPLCSIERFAIFIIGLICIAGAIYLFKPTSQIIATPLNAAKEGVKAATTAAGAA